ncbi:hypothetical protein OJF2_23840 [Aquisphaera giovannonii]|uniref:HD/PDEase domain-containing protein n=1 Tax=Aquisphaera giovannonii TaxID=406548 RepID=A0A5B9W008_9BACT|nr:HD domain-containing protein [Aquisphaera giovannonii]QEH33853.1 hypothetical protein OJF2_23840 [Aquisphaera giovannonii]
MQDKFRKKYRVPAATERLRKQIAVEAARRLLDSAPADDPAAADWIAERPEADLYAAKRKAAAVLGHRIRPGDLPSDGEVREEAARLWRSRARDEADPEDAVGDADGAAEEDQEEEAPDPADPPEGYVPPALSERLDRFTVYRMRLAPLESIKQDARSHPEGDALYHSLQVFELAREARPYDEEFLLAALLHDVGKAIDPRDARNAASQALRGAVTERTLRLIVHLDDDRVARSSEVDEQDGEDLRLLRELDLRGRLPGAAVVSIEEALAYIRGLEDESYLDPT